MNWGKSSINFTQGVLSGINGAFDWYKEKYGVYMYVGDEKELSIGATERKFYNSLCGSGFYCYSKVDDCKWGLRTDCIFDDKGNMYV